MATKNDPGAFNCYGPLEPRAAGKRNAVTYLESGAHISTCGAYRYKLWREWRTGDPSDENPAHRKNWRWFGCRDRAGVEMGEPKSVLFVMLNPSTADGAEDDATIRKCVGFARRWDYERIEVANLFAWRAIDPRALFAAHAAGKDIFGYRNQDCITDLAVDAGLIVCAWGANAAGWEFHAEAVRGWLGDKPQYHLGLTRGGHPRHPLYVPYGQEPTPFAA